MASWIMNWGFLGWRMAQIRRMRTRRMKLKMRSPAQHRRSSFLRFSLWWVHTLTSDITRLVVVSGFGYNWEDGKDSEKERLVYVYTPLYRGQLLGKARNGIRPLFLISMFTHYPIHELAMWQYKHNNYWSHTLVKSSHSFEY